MKDVADRVTAAVVAAYPLESATKWGRLTFAVNGDYDHWICAVVVTKTKVSLTFHFSSLLDAPGVFAAGDSKYVRRIDYTDSAQVDDAAITRLIEQAIGALPDFITMTAR
ncbi:hypothetical protein A5761_04335 [Mycolicibacterium setense]|uniref:DUF1801 domain-containing protein n=1 Tax=Mycolicibacterium setense TaxID=431269 RepID=UPI0007EC15A5|nr:DUF1801 domain-containing protein [Mycolicibacterium setense]OBB20737.1 hypothetical protein A5761_04335 [Mycolicibacterium setense]